MKRILFTAALFIAAASANASSTTTPGYVTDFYVLNNGVVLFNTNNTRSAAPACQGSSTPNRWAFDGTTATGQVRLAAVATAFSLHKPIAVVGLGNCGVWSDSESLDYVQVIG